MRALVPSLLLIAAGCTTADDSLSARVSGHLDLSTFPMPGPVGFEAIGDDGDSRNATLAADGAFELSLKPDDTYVFRVVFASGGGYPVALPRLGHYDRGLVTGGRVEARLGTVWLPPGTSEVTGVLERDGASCPEGRLEDGSPCSVIEATPACADGPARPTEDPSGLFLGTGTLDDLPGPGRYVVPARVPPPILWDCATP